MSHDQSRSLQLSLVLAALLVGLLAGVMLLLGRSSGAGQGAAAHDLVEGSREQARTQGLVLPGEARRVHLQMRRSATALSHFVRFDLPAGAFAAYRLELARRPGAKFEVDRRLPISWPSPERLGESWSTPDWWREHELRRGKVVVIVEQRPSSEPPDRGTPPAAAEFWVLDEERGRVYLWSWSWPGRAAARSR